MTHFDELKLFIEINKPDIIGISETKLDKTINDCNICVPGYRMIRKDRNCYGGGVLMYLNESLNVKHREDLDFDIESISVEIKIGNYKPFLVTTIYGPPDKPVSYFDQIETLISSTELEDLRKSLYIDILKNHAPVTDIRLKGSTLPHMTKDLKNMIRQRDYLKAIAFIIVSTGPKYLFQDFRQIRSRVFSSLKQLRKDYHTKKLKEAKGDMKKTWKILKSAMNQPTKANPIEKLVFNDEELTDSIKIAGACNEHFASAGENLAAQIKNLNIDPVDTMIKANTHFRFKPAEVCQAVKVTKKLLNGKAVGIYSIPNMALKEGVELIAPSLCDVFNCAIYTKTYQTDLNIAKVSAIFNLGIRKI